PGVEYAGPYDLQLRYSNAGPADAVLNVSINGSVVSGIRLPATGSSTQWQMFRLSANLTSRNTFPGSPDTIRFTATGSGHVHVDQLRVRRRNLSRFRPGDADADGDVDSADLNTVVTHFTGALPPGTGGKVWAHGDFDGDGD